KPFFSLVSLKIAMARLREHEIDYFQSLSNWENRQDIINFLEMHKWDPAVCEFYI
ncbi:unnamed protein product, partial [Rotaria sp. Silwood1]